MFNLASPALCSFFRFPRFSRFCGGAPLIFVLLLTFSLPVKADTTTPAKNFEQQLLALQHHYRQLSSLKFNFSQITRTGARKRIGSGTALFLRSQEQKKPGIMRWDYTTPDPQIIVNDGDKLSIYTKKDHQLIITSAAELNGDISYAFFSGKHDIKDDFAPSTATTNDRFALPGLPLKVLRLTPRKPHPQIKALEIWFDNQYLIHHILLEDHFDSTTTLTLTNIQTNTIDSGDHRQIQAILDLKLPENTEIITQ